MIEIPLKIASTAFKSIPFRKIYEENKVKKVYNYLQKRKNDSRCLRDFEMQLYNCILEKNDPNRNIQIRQIFSKLDYLFSFDKTKLLRKKMLVFIEMGFFEIIKEEFDIKYEESQMIFYMEDSNIEDIFKSNSYVIGDFFNNLKDMAISNILSIRWFSEITQDDLKIIQDNEYHICDCQNCVPISYFVLEGDKIDNLHCRLMQYPLPRNFNQFSVRFKIVMSNQNCSKYSIIPFWLKSIFPNNVSTNEIPEYSMTNVILNESSNGISFSNGCELFGSNSTKIEVMGKFTHDLTINVLNLLVPMQNWFNPMGFEDQKYTKDRDVFLKALIFLKRHNCYPNKSQLPLTKSNRVNLINFMYVNFKDQCSLKSNSVIEMNSNKRLKYYTIKKEEEEFLQKEVDENEINFEISRDVIREKKKAFNESDVFNLYLNEKLNVKLQNDILVKVTKKVKFSPRNKDQKLNDLYIAYLNDIKGQKRKEVKCKIICYKSFKKIILTKNFPFIQGKRLKKLSDLYHNDSHVYFKRANEDDKKLFEKNNPGNSGDDRMFQGISTYIDLNDAQKYIDLEIAKNREILIKKIDKLKENKKKRAINVFEKDLKSFNHQKVIADPVKIDFHYTPVVTSSMIPADTFLSRHGYGILKEIINDNKHGYYIVNDPFIF